jgi:hypothetical protein
VQATAERWAEDIPLAAYQGDGANDEELLGQKSIKKSLVERKKKS